jgi:hypothetical protein
MSLEAVLNEMLVRTENSERLNRLFLLSNFNLRHLNTPKGVSSAGSVCSAGVSAHFHPQPCPRFASHVDVVSLVRKARWSLSYSANRKVGSSSGLSPRDALLTSLRIPGISNKIAG